MKKISILIFCAVLLSGCLESGKIEKNTASIEKKKVQINFLEDIPDYFTVKTKSISKIIPKSNWIQNTDNSMSCNIEIEDEKVYIVPSTSHEAIEVSNQEIIEFRKEESIGIKLLNEVKEINFFKYGIDAEEYQLVRTKTEFYSAENGKVYFDINGIDKLEIKKDDKIYEIKIKRDKKSENYYTFQFDNKEYLNVELIIEGAKNEITK